MSNLNSPLKLLVAASALATISSSCSAPVPPVNSAASSPVVALPSPSAAAADLPASQRPLTPLPIPTVTASSRPVSPASSTSATYQVIDEQQKNAFAVTPSQLFSAGKLPAATVNFDAQKLLTVLGNTKAYFQKNLATDPNIVRTGILASQGVTIEDTFKTLDFMMRVLQEDIQAQRPPRLQDANFIRKNFRVIKWQSFNPRTPRQQKIRITKYAVFTHPGSRTKTSVYDTAIYSLKGKQAGFNYRQYTKQQVLAGIYDAQGQERGKVDPIAYLTRDGLEDALMEGTVLIKFTDGTQGLFNVDRSNEIPYVKGLDRRQQQRYWYFKQVEKIKGYGYKDFATDEKISIEPGVTFAGDVLNIGLGKVVAIEVNAGQGRQLRLGVIADTGGAFLPNLYQLDFLAGFFDNTQEFRAYSRQLPEFTTAYFLVKK